MGEDGNQMEEERMSPIPQEQSPVEDEREQEAVLEAVLFTMGRSVELSQLGAAIGQSRETAAKAMERLKRRYEENEVCGMQIIQLEDSYQMCTKARYYENLIRVAAAPKKQVLTEVMLETLSIIAYKQPVTKMEIEKIRGVKSDHAVNRLIEYNLVYEAGRDFARRMQAAGAPMTYYESEGGHDHVFWKHAMTPLCEFLTAKGGK